jgi:hypothetical protein
MKKHVELFILAWRTFILNPALFSALLDDSSELVLDLACLCIYYLNQQSKSILTRTNTQVT